MHIGLGTPVKMWWVQYGDAAVEGSLAELSASTGIWFSWRCFMFCSNQDLQVPDVDFFQLALAVCQMGLCMYLHCHFETLGRSWSKAGEFCHQWYRSWGAAVPNWRNWQGVDVTTLRLWQRASCWCPSVCLLSGGVWPGCPCQRTPSYCNSISDISTSFP